MSFIYREAVVADIAEIQIVRNSVKENTLSDPALVSDKDCEEYMRVRGKAWVCESDNIIQGFAYVDLQDNNIWALFVKPDFMGLGMGKELHRLMLDWYFSVTDKPVWLGTAPGTKAEEFYRRQGWKEVGMHEKEAKFEMYSNIWLSK